jgi:hypothetical protein
MTKLFSDSDIDHIKSLGMSQEGVLEQIETFKRGFKNVVLDRPCTLGDGILRLEKGDVERLSAHWEEAALKGRGAKFVPASGAASRMFKMLLFFMGSGENIREDEIMRKADAQGGQYGELLRFIRGIKKFAFYDELKTTMARQHLDVEALIKEGEFREILDFLLGRKGLGAASLPKGLIPFHSYPDGNRTPFEEHLVEGVQTIRDKSELVRVHFTVPAAHEEAIREHLEGAGKKYEKHHTRFELEFSIQMSRTDTIAVDLENRPIRDERGRLVFRPGGHGALLENLNEMKGDVAFIKNIDNVVPDYLKEPTIIYKKALGGCLLEIQEEVFSYLGLLEQGLPDEENLKKIWSFARKELSMQPPPALEKGSAGERKNYLFSMLNRPIRVCGMVKNQGEPGGGPFWVRRDDGGLSLQIVESSQVDMGSAGQEAIWKSSTHFNPVDLVCCVRDYKGEQFDLPSFRDPETGFISKKSKGGRDLKALELPGLWNGSMAYWNTVFVEVPIETFSPVKTVLDLLRDEHQPLPV